jgi:hypothetical protein
MMRNKMSATMISMELVYADNLTPDQLMADDLIEVEDQIVTVIGVESDSTGDNYFIAYTDDYGDKDVIELSFDSKVKLFVFIEPDE